MTEVAVASRASFERAAEILDEAEAWAAVQGFRSWEPGAFSTAGTFERRALLSAFHSGDLYLARDGGRAVATVSLFWEDRLYWPTAPDDGAYVHRLAVRRTAARTGDRPSSTGLGRRRCSRPGQEISPSRLRRER